MDGKRKAVIAIIIVISILIITVIGLMMNDSPHDARIDIDGDVELLNEADHNNWPGDGSSESPFIIDSAGINISGIVPCISITNTSKYIIIQNCELTHELDDQGSMIGIGIRLNNVENVTVIDNEVRSVVSGLEVISCSNLIIKSNSIEGSLDCSDSDHVHFINNSFAGTGSNVMIQSIYNVFQGNVFQATMGTGLLIQDSDLNEFSNNTFEGKALGAGGTQGWTGLVLTGSSNNSLYMDQMKGGGYLSTGAGMIDSNDNSISHCTLIGRTGMYMSGSCCNEIISNDFQNAFVTSMDMVRSDHNSIIRNDMDGNYSINGVRMVSCDENIIMQNRMSGRSTTAYIMDLNDSIDNIIFNNTILYNGSEPRALKLAFDDTGLNRWNDSANGNHWSDWTLPDADMDGVVDDPYVLDGGEGATDWYPSISPISTS